MASEELKTVHELLRGVDLESLTIAERRKAIESGVYLAGQDPRHPYASPLYADMGGLPPLLIHVGDAEVILDDSTRVAARAREAGVDVTLEVWDEMPHVFHAWAGLLPESDQAIERIGEWLRARWRLYGGLVPAQQRRGHLAQLDAADLARGGRGVGLGEHHAAGPSSAVIACVPPAGRCVRYSLQI